MSVTCVAHVTQGLGGEVSVCGLFSHYLKPRTGCGRLRWAGSHTQTLPCAKHGEGGCEEPAASCEPRTARPSGGFRTCLDLDSPKAGPEVGLSAGIYLGCDSGILVKGWCQNMVHLLSANILEPGRQETVSLFSFVLFVLVFRDPV